MRSPQQCSNARADARICGAMIVIATLGVLAAQTAAAKVRPQPGLLALDAVQGLGQIGRFHLAPSPGIAPAIAHATLRAPLAPARVTTVAVARLAPHADSQFTPPPSGMVEGVALGGMVLPAQLVDPVITYQPRRKGPIVELGVAGGGMPTNAGLAHVGMHWKF